MRSGSHAHGLNIPESDEDSRGICIPPKRYYFGLAQFEQWQSEGGDHVIFSLKKFVKLALEGNPNIIETLYTRPQERLFVHPLAKELLDNRNLFLSKNVGNKFSHYAIQQLRKLQRHHNWTTKEAPTEPKLEAYGALQTEGSPKFPSLNAEKAYRSAVKYHRSYQNWKKHRNPKRAKLEEKYGYDTKHAMHLCRLLSMGIEILETAQVQVYRQDAEWLKSVRNGYYTYPQLIDWVESRTADLKEAENNSSLPDSPNRAAAEDLLIDITEQFLRLG